MAQDQFEQIVGQRRAKTALREAVEGARRRQDRLPHILLHGPAGTGKTMTARITAEEFGCEFIELHATTISTTDDLRRGIAGDIVLGSKSPQQRIWELENNHDSGTVSAKHEKSQIVFLDEIHRLKRPVQENLYAVMDDGVVFTDHISGSMTTIDLPPTSIIGATTDAGLLTQSLRDRFSRNLLMRHYEEEDIVEIGRRYVLKEWEDYTFNEEGLKALAFPARYNPRLLGNLIDCCIDASEDGEVGIEEVGRTLYIQDYESCGLYSMDKSYLETLLQGPTSLEVLSMNTDTDKTTLREVVEPFLSRMGFIQRSSRGRRLTDTGRDYLKREFGLTVRRER